MGEIGITLHATSVTNRLLLKSRLYDIRLEEGKPLKPHLDEFFFHCYV